MGITRFAIWGVAAMLAVTLFGPARANVFTVEDVAVDARAASAAQARELAQALGRRQAFEQVLKRITMPSDWMRLPQPDDQTLAKLGAGFQIQEERNSQERYLGTITYSFSPEGVRDVLRRSSIAFSESQARPAVVLPVLVDGGQAILWEQPNPWLAAWSKRSLLHELVPVEAPLGDLRDIGAIDATRALGAHWPDLEPLAQRYGSGDVLVAYAQISRDGSSYDAGAGAAAGQDVLLEVTVTRVDEMTRKDYAISAVGPLTANPDGTGQTVFDKAVSDIMAALSEDWKALTLVDYNAMRQIDATVTVASLQDWSQIRKTIDDIATVTDWRTRALSSRGAEIRVVFAGSVEQLALNLDQKGLALSGEAGYWQISRKGFTVPSLQDSFGQRPPVDTVRLYGSGFGAAQDQPDAGRDAPLWSAVPDERWRDRYERDQRGQAEDDGYIDPYSPESRRRLERAEEDDGGT